MSEPFQEIAPGAFVSREQPVIANAGTVAWLKKQAERSPKRRARLCAHLSAAAPVHEMIIVLLPNGYIRPHRHFNKSESMHVMEGRAAIIYFTDKGEPLSLRFLGRDEKNDHVFCRTERAVYHTVLVLTPSFVFHETVQGPFQTGDTEFAPWSPEEQDAPGIMAFTQRINDLAREAAQPGCSWAGSTL